MAEYKATCKTWQRVSPRDNRDKYITPKDRAFMLYSQGPPALGNAHKAIMFHEKAVLWWAAMRAVAPCEKPFLLKLEQMERVSPEEPVYDDVPLSCFEFITLYSGHRRQMEPPIGYGDPLPDYDYCEVCTMAKEIYEGPTKE